MHSCQLEGNTTVWMKPSACSRALFAGLQCSSVQGPGWVERFQGALLPWPKVMGCCGGRVAFLAGPMLSVVNRLLETCRKSLPLARVEHLRKCSTCACFSFQSDSWRHASWSALPQCRSAVDEGSHKQSWGNYRVWLMTLTD